MMIGMRLRVGMKLSRDFVMLSDFPTGMPAASNGAGKGQTSDARICSGHDAERGIPPFGR